MFMWSFGSLDPQAKVRSGLGLSTHPAALVTFGAFLRIACFASCAAASYLLF